MNRYRHLHEQNDSRAWKGLPIPLPPRRDEKYWIIQRRKYFIFWETIARYRKEADAIRGMVLLKKTDIERKKN